MPKAKKSIIHAFKEIQIISQELIRDVTAEPNERAKRERTGLLIKQLHQKNTLSLFFSLIQNVNSKSEESDLRHNLIQQAEKLKNQLPHALAVFLPSQSNGLPIAKATFNYYTINKKTTDYTEKIEEQLKHLSVEVESIFSIAENKIIDKKIQTAIIKDIKEAMCAKNTQTLLFGDVPPSIKYEQGYVSLRQILKNIKAKQKAKFNELMTKSQTTLQTIKNTPELYLFHIAEKQFNDYKQKTQKIQQLAEKLNSVTLSEQDKQKCRSEKEKIAKERGSLLKDEFNHWKTFMELYRAVAQKHGKILATLKGIEKEKTESQLLKYWAVILETNQQHKLVLIPRDKAKEAKEWINKNKVKTDIKNVQNSLYWFESMTFRSLQKLCWGHVENGNNEFHDNIKDITKGMKGEHEFKGNEQSKINFYKNVLKHEYTKENLNLPFDQVNEKIIKESFKGLEDFQIALEKICYRRMIALPQNPEKELQQFNAQIFNITSLDLQKKSNLDKLKPHTKLWQQFWTKENETQHFDIRLNPEITITYRLYKSSRVHKYGEGTALYDPNKKNRYLYPQFTLITTMSEHSNSPTKNLSFITEDEFEKSINEFNTKFKKEDIKFALGIDNGEVELSTVGVFLCHFDKSTPEERYKELQDVNKHGFKTLTIKDLNYSETDYKGNKRKIIQNPSYFLSKELYMKTFNKTEQEYEEMRKAQFEERYLLSLDLSTAKVICGHIVTNGDVPALFNLWMRHAQRNIYEMNDHIKQETAKRIVLKDKLDTPLEREKFAKIISTEKYSNLAEREKEKYLTWLFEDRSKHNYSKEENDKFNKILNRKGNYAMGIIFAVCYVGEQLTDINDIFDIRNVFKKREDFYSYWSEEKIKEELQKYNTNRTAHNISNEELDLRIKNLKENLVANAVGVIDFLYKQYKQRYNGEGLIVKEGFDTNSVEKGLEKFSGNIYRTLERKLYQKFQNYGLVPPIKSLLTVRSEGIEKEHEILRLGNIAFVGASNTSNQCPKCDKKNMKHGKSCPDCNFDAKNIMHSNDGIAGFNIAKRGFKNF